jgi:2,4-dichlorophenol 6-monooxygenase
VGDGDARDPYRDWPVASEIEEAGALLVRRDGYVAWRRQQPVWSGAEAAALLRDALRNILDHSELG